MHVLSTVAALAARSAAVIACDALSAVTLSASTWRTNSGSPVPPWLQPIPPYAWMTVSYAPLRA